MTNPAETHARSQLAELRALLTNALGPMPSDWPHFLDALRRKLGQVDDFDEIRRQRDRAQDERDRLDEKLGDAEDRANEAERRLARREFELDEARRMVLHATTNTANATLHFGGVVFTCETTPLERAKILGWTGYLADDRAVIDDDLREAGLVFGDDPATCPAAARVLRWVVQQPKMLHYVLGPGVFNADAINSFAAAVGRAPLDVLAEITADGEA